MTSEPTGTITEPTGRVPPSDVSATVPVEVYVAVRTFYARQMSLLDALRLEDYAASFTEDAVVEHRHRNARVDGRAAMLEEMRAAAGRYAGVAVRHWLDQLVVRSAGGGRWHVTYCALVTRTDADGRTSFESTYAVEDELLDTGDGLRTRFRAISRDPVDRPGGEP